jgi:glycyl-tRNA synthetase beta chain
VTGAEQWLTELRERHVLADIAERRTRMLEQLAVFAADRGADTEFDADLVEEVVQLVEWPRVIVGRFSAALLELPPRLLVESMKKNQRYFPLTRGGELTNEFLVVINNPYGDDTLIADGNARVLAARFHDARFFYAEDRKKTLAQHGERLAGMMWIRGFGSMAERQLALATAVGPNPAGVGIARLFGADEEATVVAATLCKADLTTQMVGEFPELQGHVGRLLAAYDGHPETVCRAIEGHYHPRFSGDTVPSTPEGLALAVAERVTLLAATFARGMVPKGSSDALGLRRAAGGLLAILLDPGAPGIHLDLPFAEAGTPLSDELADFILARLRALLQEDAPPDLVDAVLAVSPRQVRWSADRVRALRALPREDYAAIRANFKRAAGLVKDHVSADFSRDRFTDPSEHALADAIWTMPAPGSHNLDEILLGLVSIRPVLARFFDAVLVMDPNPELRDNRLGMLRAIVDNFGGLADFTRLSGD